LPYTINPETNAVIELDETYVELDEQIYDVPYSKIVEFKHEFKRDDFETQELFVETIKNWLREQAQAYIESHKLPKVNYSVLASIDNVNDIGDTIQVKHPKCNLNLMTEVIAVRYDAIRKCYSNIEFSNFKRELKNLTQTITAEANKHTDAVVQNAETMLSTKLEESTSRINNVLGSSFVIYEGDKILVVDALPKENARNVIKISNGGIGFSQDGINGTFRSAWTIDGTLNMQNINVINMTASLIKGGTLRLGGNDDTNGTFELCDSSNNIIAKMTNDGLTVYASNGEYVKLNGDVGLAGYDIQDQKIFWADGETFHMRNAEVEEQITLGGKAKIVPIEAEGSIGIGFVAIG
jgi:phage-related protein